MAGPDGGPMADRQSFRIDDSRRLTNWLLVVVAVTVAASALARADAGLPLDGLARLWLLAVFALLPVVTFLGWLRSGPSG